MKYESFPSTNAHRFLIPEGKTGFRVHPLIMTTLVHSLLLSILTPILITTTIAFPTKSPFTSMFVFGDSLIDPGNNNNLFTLAKANHRPYGIDFELGPTGRFTNGKTFVDCLGDLLGMPLIPAFTNSSATGPELLKGVNYASSASGILDDTGLDLGQDFSMDAQIQQFRGSLNELKLQLNEGLEDFISKSLIISNMGTNDYLNNYLVNPDKRVAYTANAFNDILVQNYTRQMEDLYNLGVRNFLILGNGPLGCTPTETMLLIEDNACNNRINELMVMFNNKLQQAIPAINEKLKGSVFYYWDSYNSAMDIINNPSKHGFKNTLGACCKWLCLLDLPTTVCANRSEYIFWDEFHTTEAFNILTAKGIYKKLNL